MDGWAAPEIGLLMGEQRSLGTGWPVFGRRIVAVVAIRVSNISRKSNSAPPARPSFVHPPFLSSSSFHHHHQLLIARSDIRYPNSHLHHTHSTQLTLIVPLPISLCRLKDAFPITAPERRVIVHAGFCRLLLYFGHPCHRAPHHSWKQVLLP